MYQSVTFNTFSDAFNNMNRSTNFSYDGLRALFEYLESYEEDCESGIELDVIGLCCEYTEYANLAELQENYTDIESMDDLHDNTQVIDIDGTDGFIILDY